jgi:two-component system, NtrC family, nitrogen regulation sensor histidine kinase NtrY
MKRRGPRFALQWRVTAALVIIVLIPFALSYVLLDQIGRSAANYKANEARESIAAMDKALDAYRDLFETTKRLHADIADRLSRRAQLIALDPKADLEAILDEEVAAQSHLRGIALLREDGSVVIQAEHPMDAHQEARMRDKVVDQPLGNGGSLHLTFAVPAMLQDEYQNLNKMISKLNYSTEIRSALPDGYRITFLVTIVLASIIVAFLGIIMSRRIITRRVDALVATARRVSDGHVDARVDLPGRDEMAELGGAFNTMLDDLAQTRSQIEYLQRIGAWQDVARRLAHEIKNPLTPIQLAVQQTVSSYKGDDAKFKKQLTDTKEIVEEEIEGLRRLVDTFRTLGQLPKVEKAPIALAELVEELRLDPTFAAKLEIQPSPQPVTVRADKLLLKRVLANLVENGIHAGQEAGSDGRVVVAWLADARGDSVRITVDDRGKGVSEENRDKIFEPYVTTKATGTGLGLAIARKIAIEHGGELSVAPDRPPSGGARFVVTLPLRGPDASLG